MKKILESNHSIPKRRIGIMGGTFDPVHFGHLVAAEEAYFSLGFSEVFFVPTGVPPHKNRQRVSAAEDRYQMTMLATLDNPHFKLTRLEIDRQGPSHTVDTLKEMRHWYAPGSASFYFITGLDAVLDILSWKEPYEIVQLAHVVAVSRPGYSSGKLEELPDPIRRAIIPLEIPLLSISSTEIRQRVSEGRSIRYFLPWTVEHFIYKKSLYSLSGW